MYKRKIYSKLAEWHKFAKYMHLVKKAPENS